MRFLIKDLKTVYVFGKREVDSGYVGTKIEDVYSHSVKCNVQPADSKITSEIYGERVCNMFSIMCGKNDEIGYKISFDSKEKPTHKVISEKVYTTHKVVLAEAII